MMGLPFVMVYRVSLITYMMGKPRVKVPRFAMVNLIAEEEVVPELVQQDFTAANVVARLNEILPDGPARERMIEGLAGVKAKLRGPVGSGMGQHPADRAAEIILNLRLMLETVSRSPAPKGAFLGDAIYGTPEGVPWYEPIWQYGFGGPCQNRFLASLEMTRG